MQRFRCITKTRTRTRLFSCPLFSSASIVNDNPLFFVFAYDFCISSNYYSYSSIPCFSCPSSNDYPIFHRAPTTVPAPSSELQARDVVLSFKNWFKRRNNPLFDKIFDILRESGEDDISLDLALSQLGLHLSETLVLEILNYNCKRKGVLSCLKFFDWAGRQPGFNHTRVTFNAIFKILSREKLMSLMMEFLENYRNEKKYAIQKVRFHSTLIMGYAVAGKPEVALQLFGRMRFHGVDLDGFAYHVLLNALVEQNYFDAVEVVAKQISFRGFETEVTHAIMMKNLCKQNQLDDAESSLRVLVASGWELNGYSVGILVDALCKSNQFEKAARLLEEFREMGMVHVEHAYGVWIRDLVQAGKLDGALQFLQNKNSLEGYVPDVFRCNILICRLLRENRLQEVCDLLMEMKERLISPNEVTMNAVLCFFCKAGMVDVALELFNSRIEFGLSPNYMAYNYLINTLCGDGSIDEAFCVLKNSIDGYFPGIKTFSILADALCREGKFNKMKELLVVALERNFMMRDSTYDKFISALCRANRVDDGYLIHGELNKYNRVTSQNTYFNLIYGFNKCERGDIASRLLIEMQEKGHRTTRKLYRAVIRCLCDMENSKYRFYNLLEMQLSHHEPNCRIYNVFIDGAGHAKKPELAREVFEMMVRSGIKPNLTSDVLMLQSFLKSKKISDALNFFRDLSKRRKIGQKLSNGMIIGLCKANRLDLALDILGEIREKKVIPSLECYEELVRTICTNEKYDMIVNLLDDLTKVGRHVSSFICNVLLLHLLKSQDLFWAWARSRDEKSQTSSSVMLLDQLIGAFASWSSSQDLLDLVELIEQCFPLDIYTYNMLLRRLSFNDMESACELFSRLCQKGYEPNRWTYDILVHGFFKHGRTAEARTWLREMFKRGFDPTDHTKRLI